MYDPLLTTRFLEAIGGRSRSTSTAGCCGSCCKKSFDNDELADELEAARKERQEREQADNQSQPKAKEDMQAPSPRQSGEQPDSKNAEGPLHETK